MKTPTERSPHEPPKLDDSWFERSEVRAIAAELRARLAQLYRADALRANGALHPGAAQPGLDDSWFK